MTEIKDNLEAWELEMFRASCFGHFLNLNREWTERGKQEKRNTFAGQYVHFLLLRRMRIPKKKEIWFLVEGKPARFSIKDFAMVSGLRCHDRLAIPAEKSSKWKNRLRDEHFGGSTQIKLDDLAKVFRKMCEREPAKKEKR